MTEFYQDLDIANRALQLCQFPRVASLQDMSGNAVELNFALDKARRIELRRNLWRTATRRVNLWVIDAGTSIVSFPAWSSATTYAGGQVVTYVGPDGNTRMWVSTKDTNLAHTPGVYVAGVGNYWDPYFGPMTVDPWNQYPLSNTVNQSYLAGDLAYVTPGNGTVTVYRSLVEGNTNYPAAVDAWSQQTVYSTGAVVSYLGVNYQGRVNLNRNNIPSSSPTQWTTVVTNPLVSGSWTQVSTTVNTNPIVYPLTAGPYSDVSTTNAFRLPHGYLRAAPQDPKRTAAMFLGVPRWQTDDYVFEGNYIVTSSLNANLTLRFVADVTNVAELDDLFCEGWACRAAMMVGPILHRDNWKTIVASVRQAYLEAIRDARGVNAIEIGPTDPEEDDYIKVRI